MSLRNENLSWTDRGRGGVAKGRRRRESQGKVWPTRLLRAAVKAAGNDSAGPGANTEQNTDGSWQTRLPCPDPRGHRLVRCPFKSLLRFTITEERANSAWQLTLRWLTLGA
jgi:hypothetical protein